MFEERRRAPRHPVYLEVRELDGQPGTDSYLLDLSEWGAKLEAPIAFTRGAVVELSFVLPGERGATRRRGRVVWVLPLSSQGRCRLGLEFSEPISF